MKSSGFPKSPFDNVLNLLGSIPQGHEKALKHALYNAVATLLLVVGILAGCGLFYILEPFVKPLVWALLVGSVLHPFKRKLEIKFEHWLNHVESSSQPLLLSIILVPVHLIDESSEVVGNTIRRYLEWLITGCVAVVAVFLVYTYIPNFFLRTVSMLWNFFCDNLLWLLHNFTPTMMGLLTIAYISILITQWSKSRWVFFVPASYLAWFLISLFVARTIGIFTVPIFIFLNFIALVGFAYEVYCINQSSPDKSYISSLYEAFSGVQGKNKAPTSQKDDEKTSGQEEKNSDLSPGKDEVETPTPQLRPSGLCTVPPNVYSARRSDPEMYFRASSADVKNLQSTGSWWYIYAVLWGCFVVLLWRNIWLAHLLPIPVIILSSIFLIKKSGYYFGVWSILFNQIIVISSSLTNWLQERETAMYPAPIKGIVKLSMLLRIKLLEGLREFISLFSSTIVILALISFLFLFTMFLILKIYAEGIHMVAMGASVINSTVVHNPEFLQLLPDGWSDKMEAMLNNAYIYGREGISKQLRNMMKDVEQTKAAELERHVLEFWDRVYQAWLMTAIEPSSTVGPKVPTSAVANSWNNFVEIIHKSPGVFNMSLATEFLKDNVVTLLSLSESVWALLKGNVSLLFHFLFAVVSVLLGGGSAVLNFLLNVIVFFTALFYLLSSSSDLYKPVDMISNFSPVNGNKFGLAFESAVNGVFKASFKMALFYGLWTWLIHNLFQVKIIYLPSVLAAMLGAVPFLGTYWASVPAVLELWLAQNQGILALLLLICQCLPMSFVDTAIYTEIRGGGHPYMTGLAIAGGVFCMGIQGAIFGPLLLCCLLVALNMSSNLMKESPTDPAISTLSRQLRRMDTVM